MADVIQFKVLLPTLTDLDVVTRTLSVQVADGAPVVKEVAKGDTEVTGFEGTQGATVKLSLVDVDDAGNQSPASILDAVLTDVFPPTAPGVLGIVQTGEVVTPDVIPEPEPTV